MRALPAALALLLACLPLAAAEPGDPDYEPDEDEVRRFEELAGQEPDYAADEGAFGEALQSASADPPDTAPPTGEEVREFRGALESHWNGNLPALLAYLGRLDPASASNPDPPGEGQAAGWSPRPDLDAHGNVIKSSGQKRREWRRRVERRLEQLAGN